MAKQKFYAWRLLDSNLKGIAKTWDECKAITNGMPSRLKSFKTIEEAQEWLNGTKQKKEKLTTLEELKPGIYFDSGTGRQLRAPEVRVTRRDGNSILKEYLKEEFINQYGNYLLEEGESNNFGELLGLYFALNIAIKTGEQVILGDSKLVIDFWSLGKFNKGKLNKKTLSLIAKVFELRQEFEALGGKVLWISGDLNVSDLGYHK